METTKTLIERTVAQQEIDGWLNFKKVHETKRKLFEAAIENLVDAVSSGDLVVNEDHSLSLKLCFPIEGESPVTELKFVPRLKLATIQHRLSGTKGTDQTEQRVAVYAAALSNKPLEVIKQLDTEDLTIIQSIVCFFM